MIKYTRVYFSLAILFVLCGPLFALGSDIFKITATGKIVSPFTVTACLNVELPFSCQKYTVSALNLSIQTTISNQTYPMAGIKVNSAGFTIANCAFINGYCQFSVSDTQASTMNLYPSNQPYSIKGTISGLISKGLILQNNGANNLMVPAHATSFDFSYITGVGIPYNITILKQPTRELCTVSNGAGSGATGDVTNIIINCSPIPLAYISNYQQNTQVLSNVSYCPLNASSDSANGSFQYCSETPSINPNWIPYSVVFAKSNSSLYAYVVSNRSYPWNWWQGIYLCSVDPSTGAFQDNSCFLVYATETQPTGIAVAFIGGTEYVYYTDNVLNHVNVCTIDSLSGMLQCNSAITSSPPRINSYLWAPYAPTITTINGRPYAFIADWANSAIWQCTVQEDGTFIQSNANVCTPFQSSWNPYGVTTATLGETQSLYIASRNDQTLYQCPFASSTINPSDCTAYTLANWQPTGVSITSVNSVPYAYIASPYSNLGATPPIYPSVYQCTFSAQGQVNSCTVVSTSTSTSWTPYNITMQVIPDALGN